MFILEINKCSFINLCKYLSIFIIFFTELFSETISVKYRGKLIIEDTYLTEMELRDSSLVKRVFYDQRNNYLIVKLNATYYHYCGIPSFIVNEWLHSKSLGDFYKRNIRYNYDCRINKVPY